MPCRMAEKVNHVILWLAFLFLRGSPSRWSLELNSEVDPGMSKVGTRRYMQMSCGHGLARGRQPLVVPAAQGMRLAP